MSFQTHRMVQLATTPAQKALHAHPLLTQRDLPDKALIRAAYETMRQSFHDLLNTLVDGDLAYHHFATSAFSIGGLLTRSLLAVVAIPQEVASIRGGQKFRSMPRWLLRMVDVAQIQLAARTESCASLGRKFDQAVDAALAVLDTIQDDEWQQGTAMYDAAYCTVEWVFIQQPYHLTEQALTIRQLLAHKTTLRKQMLVELL